MWNDDDDEVAKLRKQQGARLKEARQRAGFGSAEAAMQRYGWSSKYRAHENGGRGIGRMYLEYAKKFKVNPAWLLCHSDDRDSVVRGLKMVGEAAIGTWREAPGTVGEPAPIVGIPATTESDMDDRFAVRVADASINKIMPQGAFAICMSIEDSRHLDQFEIGQLLYIERKRGDLRELSIRRVVKVSSKSLSLSTWSHDPSLRQELTYPSCRADEIVRILGRVVGKYEDYSAA